MQRYLKYALLALLVGNIALAWSGVIDMQAGLAIGLLLEAFLFCLALSGMLMAFRSYRRDRAGGLDVTQAVENGLAILLPRRLARLLALEPRILYYVARWLFRRRDLAEGEYTYNKSSIMSAFVAMLVVTTPAELLLAELLLPWPIVRWIIGIAAVYGLLWIAGLAVSLRVLPHRLESRGLSLHYGLLASGFVPYNLIASVETGNVKLPQGAGEGLYVPKAGRVAYLAVGNKANITLHLREPITLMRVFSPTQPVTKIVLAADNPIALSGALQERLNALPVEQGMLLASGLL